MNIAKSLAFDMNIDPILPTKRYIFRKKQFDENNCKTRENSNFRKKGKTVISVKIRNFSRYWMTKRTSPLEYSREI